MASLHRCPSYIVRNPYSYCFRMNVPSDLQTKVGKKELRYSLKTGYLGVAKSKARLMAGLCQNLFYTLRTNETVMKLPMTEIQHIVNSAIRMFLEYTEAHRLFGAKKMDFSPNHKELSDLSDAMGIRLPPNKALFSFSNLSHDAEKLTQQSLVDADYTKYERSVQTLNKMNNLDV